MTRPQMEALGVIIESGPGGAVSARCTGFGFVGTRAASSLVDMGLANRKGPSVFVVSRAGRKAHAALGGRG